MSQPAPLPFQFRNHVPQFQRLTCEAFVFRRIPVAIRRAAFGAIHPADAPLATGKRYRSASSGLSIEEQCICFAWD